MKLAYHTFLSLSRSFMKFNIGDAVVIRSDAILPYRNMYGVNRVRKVISMSYYQGTILVVPDGKGFHLPAVPTYFEPAVIITYEDVT